jgi:hypothetical protein
MFQLRGWFFIAVWGTVTAWMLTAIPQRGDGWVQYVGSPEGPGLAAKYLVDAGIERDPNVIFVENFDEPSLDAMKRRWDNVGSADIMSLSDDTPLQSNGRSLLMTHVGGKGSGGHLYRRLLPGYDRLYTRFYVKFDPQSAPIHHFFQVGGYNPSSSYPHGGAGERPRGGGRFSSGVEPSADAWVWDYYTYWVDMRGSPPRGQTWGNSFIHDSSLKVAKGKWICVELMMKMNDTGDTNGEMALWIDGKRVSYLGKNFPDGKWVYDKFLPGKGGDGIRWNDVKGEAEQLVFPEGGSPFEGFRWREDKRLNINFLWVLLYMTNVPVGQVSKVWFDNIVVARQYVGPLGK